jgi:MFS family permease
VLASISIGNLFSGATLGRLTKKYTSVQLLLVSYLLYTLALITIPAMGSEALLVIPCIVFGMAIGINNPNVQTLIAKTVRPEQRAAILSINGMVLRLGQTIGPLIMATFFAIAGYKLSYILAGFVALSIYFFLRSRVKR